VSSTLIDVPGTRSGQLGSSAFAGVVVVGVVVDVELEPPPQAAAANSKDNERDFMGGGIAQDCQVEAV